MMISADTQAVIEHLQHSQNVRLRKKNDISALLEIAASFSLPEEFLALSFTGKSLWKVYNTLRNTSSGHEGYPVLRDEMARILATLREQLLPLVAYMDDDLQQRFTAMYLGEDDGVLRNLIDLSFDLSAFKDMQSDTKRQG